MITIEQKFKKLDDISHVLLRPGRYLGSTSPHTSITYYVNDLVQKIEKSEMTWCPALLKTFDEILSNSIDFSKTKDGYHVDTVKIEIDKTSGIISVYDNGGIAVVKHKEHDQWIPEMIFELKAGSNFNEEDDSVLTGQNGEGGALTLIFSKQFDVTTADGKNLFQQNYINNGRTKTNPTIKSSSKKFTKIQWLPDYEKFNLINGLDEGNYKKLIKRVYDVVGCNPLLKIYLNGDQIKIKSFEEYIKLYTDSYIYEESENWKIGVTNADDGFSHISFVNGTHTDIGGTHISYVVDQITNKIREFVKKKHKIDVKPSDIRNQLNIFIDATIVKPRYSSQTKQDLITEVKDYKTSWSPSDKFINKILKSSVVDNIMNWVYAKEKANELAELKKLNKDIEKTSVKNVDKFVDANEKHDRKKCILILTEGDSAKGPIDNVRDTKLVGVFPLKGRVMNVSAAELSDAKDNKELVNICKITGLKFGEKVKSVNDLRFGRIMIATDADEFGSAISGQLMNTFYRFWPELYEMGVITKLITPVIKVKIKGKTKYFYSENEYNEFLKLTNEKVQSYTFLKGLGSSNEEDFDYYLNGNFKQHTITFETPYTDDIDSLDLCFLKGPGSADKRKEWLGLL